MTKQQTYDWLYVTAIGVSGIALLTFGIAAEKQFSSLMGAVFMTFAILLPAINGAAQKLKSVSALWQSGELRRDIKANRHHIAAVSAAAVAATMCLISESLVLYALVTAGASMLAWFFITIKTSARENEEAKRG